MQESIEARRDAPTARPPRRANGLFVLFALVFLGVGVTAGYMQWKAPAVRSIIDGRRSEVAAAPSTPEGRLVYWLKYSNALIHKRLQEMRFSAEQPWLVAYAVETPSSGARTYEMHGVDLADLPREPGRIAGLGIVVRLPRARSLGRGELVGDNASFVPIVPADQAAPDADKRVRELATWALNSLGEALERDIHGAHLLVEIGPEATWSDIARARAESEPSTITPAR